MFSVFTGQLDRGPDVHLPDPGPNFSQTKLACPVIKDSVWDRPAPTEAPYPEQITTELESMKNNRIRTLIERVAGRAGVPETLTRDIVPIAQRHLKAAGRQNPQQRDVVWAVDRARHEWSRRFLSALDARSTDSALNSAA